MRNNTRTNRHAAPRGFSLIEVMIVLVIIGVLGGIVTLNLVGQVSKAKKQQTVTNFKTIESGLTQYRASYNQYPASAVGLNALVAENIMSQVPLDGWGMQLDYLSPSPNGFSYEIRSAGEDQLWDTADDLFHYPDNEVQQQNP